MREFNTLMLNFDENIAVITINRPKNLNALNSNVLSELSDAVDFIEKESQIRAVIVTGSGDKAFVAGADVTVMKNIDGFEAREFSKLGNQIFSKIENLKIPVIAAINGYALGGGCELALACDIRIAGNNAKFGQPEVGLGIMAGFGGTQRLPRLVGAGIAKELLYTCDIISAQRAYEIGLVNKVVEPANVLEEAKNMAQKIASKSPLGVRMSKKAVNEGLNLDLERALSLETEIFGSLFPTNDQKEGIAAFLEKRKPNFN